MRSSQSKNPEKIKEEQTANQVHAISANPYIPDVRCVCSSKFDVVNDNKAQKYLVVWQAVTTHLAARKKKKVLAYVRNDDRLMSAGSYDYISATACLGQQLLLASG